MDFLERLADTIAKRLEKGVTSDKDRKVGPIRKSMIEKKQKLKKALGVKGHSPYSSYDAEDEVPEKEDSILLILEELQNKGDK